MKIIQGNIFNLITKDIGICVTTNGVVNSVGSLIMGKGIAKEFKDRYKGIEQRLGVLVSTYGNHVYYINAEYIKNGIYHLISFPTKWHYKNRSDMELIKRSAKELQHLQYNLGIKIYLPLPGCGYGGLDKKQVLKLLSGLLSDEITVVIRETD